MVKEIQDVVGKDIWYTRDEVVTDAEGMKNVWKIDMEKATEWREWLGPWYNQSKEGRTDG